MKQNPTDAAFAAECRGAIFRTEGELVKFPAVPSEHSAEDAELLGTATSTGPDSVGS
jgi:hypothetical protein